MGEIYNIVVEDTLDPATGVEFLEEIERAGTLLSVLLHWPDGCDGLVEITLFHITEQILPRKGTVIALNDTTQEFPLRRPVDVGDELLLRVENSDGINPHHISATFFTEVK